MVFVCTTSFNVQKLCILPAECIYVFYMILTVSSDCFYKQNSLYDLCIGDVMCVRLGMN